MIRIQKANDCSGYYTMQYLMNFGIQHFYKILGTNKIIAIRNPNIVGININDLRQVAIIESTQLPLYKQAMQLQMGRIPRNQTSIRQYRVVGVNPDECRANRVEVYDIVY